MLYSLVLALVLLSSPLVVEVLETGDAICTYTVEVVDAPAVIEVKLLGEPYLVEAYDASGGEVPFNISDGVLELYVLDNTTVTVRYLTVLAERRGRVWALNFTADSPVRVVLPENAITVGLDPVPDSIEVENGGLVLYYTGGRVYVEYLLYIPIPPATTTPTQTTPPASAPPEQPQIREHYATSYIYYVLVSAVALAVATAYVLKRGSRKGSLELDERDTQILRVIKELGGSATASEIMEKIGIPKTPLYRRLQKLVEYGILEEVRGRKTVYKLKKEF